MAARGAWRNRGSPPLAAGHDALVAARGAGARLCGRPLGPLRLPTGRSWRAPGGARDEDGAGARGESRPAPVPGRRAKPVTPFQRVVRPAARWSTACDHGPRAAKIPARKAALSEWRVCLANPRARAALTSLECGAYRDWTRHTLLNQPICLTLSHLRYPFHASRLAGLKQPFVKSGHLRDIS
jgi:hypothetical protein